MGRALDQVSDFFVPLLLITNGEILGKSPNSLHFIPQIGIMKSEISRVIIVKSESGKYDICSDHRKLITYVSWKTV